MASSPLGLPVSSLELPILGPSHPTAIVSNHTVEQGEGGMGGQWVVRTLGVTVLFPSYLADPREGGRLQ